MLLASAGLCPAGEKLPGDLALVPGSARVVATWRAADVWDGPLAKALRKAAGAELEQRLKEMEKALGAAPQNIERVTVFVSATHPRPEVGAIIHCKKKADAGILARFVPSGKAVKLGGVEVREGVVAAAFVKDGALIGLGTPSAVRAMLEGDGKRSAGLSSALALAGGGKHHLVAYIDGRIMTDQLKRELPPLPPLRLLLEAKEAVAWGDLGLTTKFSARLTFGGEEEAKKAEKVLGSFVKSGTAAAESLAKRWKKDTTGRAFLADLCDIAAKALGGATIKRTAARVEAILSATITEKKATALARQFSDWAQKEAVRMTSANNLKLIGLALHTYHDAHKQFPAPAIYGKGGKPLLSWRVAVLPYIEQEALYRKFKLDEPWNSPHNSKLIPLMPKVYRPVRGKLAEPDGTTFYQALVGKGAAFEGKSGLAFAGFTDGLSNTILVVEAGKDVVWTKPDDVPFDAGKKLPKLGGMFDEGFHALFGDGSVRFLKKTITPATLRAIITRAGGEVVPTEF